MAPGEEADAIDQPAVGEFIAFLGEDGRGIFRTLFPAPAGADLVGHYACLGIKVVLSAFESHCSRQRNEIAETFRFQQLRQKAGEPFTDYLVRLKARVTRCNYMCTCGEPTQRAIRDQIIDR